jgi:hypothetical protein
MAGAIRFFSKLASLLDVIISSPSTAQLLMYDPNTGCWRNGQLGQGSNITISGNYPTITISASGGGGSSTYFRSMWTGLTLSNDATTPNTVLDIAAGQCADQTCAALFTLSSAITKSISSTWTSGSGNGMLDVGAVAASSTYHIYGITNGSTNNDVLASLNNGNSGVVTMTIASPCVVTWANHGLQVGSAVVFATTGALPTGLTAGTTYYVISAGFTTGAFEVSTTQGGSAVNTSGSQSGTQSATSNPALPSGYTYFRRLGSLRLNSSSHFPLFLQIGNLFELILPIADISGYSLTTTAVLFSLSVPIGIKITARAGVAIEVSGNADVLFSDPDVSISGTGQFNLAIISPSGAILVGCQMELVTNNAGQVRGVSTATTTLYENTLSYTDTRGIGQ